MGSELALSGLASGFDWQPVVDQLIELEAIPKKRLQLEKRQNDEKMSELGLLKCQLDTLKGAATALQDDDLFGCSSSLLRRRLLWRRGGLGLR